MSDEAIANNSEAVAPDSGSESVTDLDSLLSEYDNSATTTTEQATASSGEVEEGDPSADTLKNSIVMEWKIPFQ
jgi:hypothetical protein